MEKKELVQKKPDLKTHQDENQLDNKLAKIKEALNGVNWNQKALFNDINGFIEGHEKNNKKIKIIENEKRKIHSELLKSDQRISLLGKKLDEKQSELLSIRNKYQERVETLLKIRNELIEKVEDINSKKQDSENKIEQFRDVIRAKESKINEYQDLLVKKDKEIRSVADDYQKSLDEVREELQKKYGEKEKLSLAKSNQILAEKNQLQTYVSELMENNLKAKKELEEIKKNIVDLSDERVSLRSENQDLKAKINKNQELVAKNISALNVDLGEKTKEINYLNKKIDELLSYQDKFKGFDKEKLELSNHISALIMDLEKARHDFDQLNQENILNIEKINELNIEIEYLNRENKSWIDKYDDVVSEHAEQIETIKLQKSELQESFDLISKELKGAEAQMNKKVQELIDQQQQIDRLEARIHASDTELDHRNLDLKKSLEENRSLKDQILLVDNKLNSIKHDFELKSKDVFRLEKELEQFAEIKLKLNNLNKDFEFEKEQSQATLGKLSLALSKIEMLEDERSAKQQEYEKLNLRAQSLNKDLEVQSHKFKADAANIHSSYKIEIDKISATLVKVEQKAEQKLQEINDLELKIKNFENNEAVLIQKNEDLLENIASLQEEIIKADESKVDAEDKVSGLNVEINQLQLVIIENKKIINVNEQQNEDLKLQIANLGQNLAQKNELLENTERSLKTILLEKENLNTELTALSDQLCDSLDKCNILQSNTSSLTREKNDLLSEITSLESIIKDRDFEVLNLQTAIDNRSNDFEDLVSKKQQLADEIIDLNITVKQKDFDLNTKTESIKKLKEELKDMEDNYKAFKDIVTLEAAKKTEQIEEQKSKSVKLIEKIKSLEVLSTDLGSKIVNASTRYEAILNQNQSLQKEMDENKDLHTKVKKKNTELELAIQSLKEREEQLNLYSRWVDSQKEGLQKQILQISAELRATKQFNPLNPYLKITEREISKIEILMTKSNVFGPQRTLLESQYEQLVKQRDEVKELLVNTNNEVDKKAKALISNLKSGEFIPVPPLPPCNVVESETELPSS